VDVENGALMNSLSFSSAKSYFEIDKMKSHFASQKIAKALLQVQDVPLHFQKNSYYFKPAFLKLMRLSNLTHI
jgi:hypothetical protein